MSLAKYRAFIKIVELGSLTKTAKQLGYSQPGISHMIDSLEAEIGFPLLIRNKDSMVPTENGKKILHYCNQIIKNEDSLQETALSINGLISGNIKIGALNSMLVNFVPKVVCDFSSAYPNIEIQIREHSFMEIQDCLRNGTIDIGFMNEYVPKGFEFIPLFQDPVCLVMRYDHPLASYEKVPVGALNGCDFLMPLPGYDDELNAVLQKEPFSPNIKHYVASDAAVIEMVSNNLGVSVLSRLQVKLLPDTVISKDFAGDFYRTLGIAVKLLKNATPALKEFIRISQEAAR